MVLTLAISIIAAIVIIGCVQHIQQKKSLGDGSLLEKYSANPILTLGESGAWDDTYATWACIIRDDDNWKMYYSGKKLKLQIGLATSSNGKTWTKCEKNPIITAGGPGEWDEGGVWCPSIIKERDEYKMLYTGRNVAKDVTQIGLATSSDGINWIKYGGNPVFNDENSWAYNDTEGFGIIKDDTNRYLLFYNNLRRYPRETSIAESTNLTTWTPLQRTPIFASPDVKSAWNYSQFCAAPFKYGENYYVILPSQDDSGDYAVFALYESADPTFPNTTRIFKGTILSYGVAGKWDDHDLDTPSVVIYDDKLSVYYAGEHKKTWQEGLALIDVSHIENRFVANLSENYTAKALSCIGIPNYYDNRDAAVTITVDDPYFNGTYYNNGGGSTADEFNDMLKTFNDANVYYTLAICTRGGTTESCNHEPVNWTEIQEKALNTGFAEVGSHSRTHPNTSKKYLFWRKSTYINYNSEINGSKNDIITNLSLPYKKGDKEYVYAWIQPYGQSDSTVRSKLGAYKYLCDRDTDLNDNSWTSWDSTNGLYNRIGQSIRIGSDWGGTEDLTTLNNKFDEVIRAGGIYHLMTHYWTADWQNASNYANQHIDYIKKRTNIWYVPFGYLYLYHYADELETKHFINVSMNGIEAVITIDNRKHDDYGFAYPITFEFNIPSGQSNHYVQKRHLKSENWVNITEKQSTDFFNGIEAVRFDYAANKAYVSVAFSNVSDDIFLKFGGIDE